MAHLVSKPPTTPELQRSVDELYRRFALTGRRYAMSILRNEADAEEIVQESFLRITRSHEDWAEKNWSEIDTIDVEGYLKARLFTTIRNLCIDQTRKRKRRSVVSLDSFEEQPGKQNSGSGSTEAKLAQQVEILLERMNSNWADALKLRINGDLSYQQIAAVLSNSEQPTTHAQVRTWIFRGRRFLEQELKKTGLIGAADDEI